jgi:16S rRNA U516 pseudouridylate synthase RsuA-like enzyme
VLKLHLIAVGNLLLDPALAPGQYRELTGPECRDIAHSYRH